MSDRELLELAAKAAGIVVGEWVQDYDTFELGHPDNGRDAFKLTGGVLWNPLDDDGDALRLAAAAGLILHTHGMGVGAHTTPGSTPEAHATAPECDEENHMISLRRCIVRAAAEIGRAKK